MLHSHSPDLVASAAEAEADVGGDDEGESAIAKRCLARDTPEIRPRYTGRT